MKSFFRGIKKGNKYFGEVIATLINSILLTIVYILGIGITAIVAKISRKKFLDLNMNNKETYWENLNLGKKPKQEYYRQF
tara:strand:+ start:2644 stop:2883 length:240 start_codon:yes stop_codon:yes gene_type:complete